MWLSRLSLIKRAKQIKTPTVASCAGFFNISPQDVMKKPENLKIVYRKTSELIPYVNNARTHSEEQVTQIASSIKEFGFNNPILIDSECGVIAGHGRLLAAKKLGLETVPTVELSSLTEIQKKAYILADNKLALNSGWDEKLLEIELDFLDKSGIDLKSVGFSNDEIENILKVETCTSEDENPYQVKTDSIQYEPNPVPPNISELVDDSKTLDLIAEIEESKLEPAEKRFLTQAAYRHLKFNYKKIADFYCEASPECQALIEKSALVIIDFNDAIKNGYVKFSKQLSALIEKKKNDDEN